MRTMGQYNLDITDQICPMTFVKTKLKLEELAVGDVLTIRMRGGEPLHNVPRSLADHGHEVIACRVVAADLHELVVKKSR